MKTIFKRTAARLRRWLYGPPDRSRPAAVLTPERVAARDEIGRRFLPILDVRPITLRDRCRCADCQAKRKVLRIFTAQPN